MAHAVGRCAGWVGVGLRFIFYQSKKGKGETGKIIGVAMTIPASWQKLT